MDGFGCWITLIQSTLRVLYLLINVKIDIQVCCLTRYKSVLKSNFEIAYDTDIVECKILFRYVDYSLDKQCRFHSVIFNLGTIYF
jgi:hypothetical protein